MVKRLSFCNSSDKRMFYFKSRIKVYLFEMMSDDAAWLYAAIGQESECKSHQYFSAWIRPRLEI